MASLLKGKGSETEPKITSPTISAKLEDSRGIMLESNTVLSISELKYVYVCIKGLAPRLLLVL